MFRSSLFALCALGACATAFSGDEKAPIAEKNFEADFRIDGWMLQSQIGYTNEALGLSQSAFLSFGEILSNVDWMVPLGADIRYKRLGFMPDLVAAKLSGGGATPGPLFERADLNLTMAILNLAAYYRIIDQPDLRFDLVGGARYLSVELDVALSGGPVGNALGTATAGTEAKVWNGIAGIRIQQDLNERLFSSLYGDAGSGDSGLTWQVWADLGYRLNEKLSVSLGYRYLDYSEVNGKRAVDLSASGPIIVFNWRF